MAKNFKIKITDQTYKQLDLYRDANGDQALTHLLVNGNPFNNCQLFTIGAIHHLIISKVTEEELKNLLSIAIQHAKMRRLCLLDINRCNVTEILEMLKPFTAKVIYNHPYTSTNSSAMNTVMVELNLDKIIK